MSMKGWKTKVGCIGMFCGGIAMAVAGFVGETVDPEKIYQGLSVCSVAFATWGVAHKVEKAGSKR